MTSKKETILLAFKNSIPVMTGYVFLGLSYGIYARVSGLPFYYPMLSSILIFGGSLEFVSVAVMLSQFSPVSTFIMALMLQARHLFYGISMLDKYKDEKGLRKFYLIFGLSDETFSVNYSTPIPENVNKSDLMFYTTLMDQSYWILASTVGGLLGGLITFNTNGIEFVMTALFVVIFLNQILDEKDHTSAIIGVICCVVSLLVFGPSNFIIPAMIAMSLILIMLKKRLEGKY